MLGWFEDTRQTIAVSDACHFTLHSIRPRMNAILQLLPKPSEHAGSKDFLMSEQVLENRYECGRRRHLVLPCVLIGQSYLRARVLW